MTSTTIRNLDDELKRRLRLRFAEQGRSMEQEVHDILRTTLSLEAQPPTNLTNSIRRRFAEIANTELPISPRESVREPPGFES